MKNIFLAGIALVALVAGRPAQAADLGVEPVKAPVMIPAYYNWGGVYVGANVGGLWTTAKGTTTDAITGAAITTDTNHNWGILGGGQIEVNFQVSPNWVIGAEGDGDMLSSTARSLSLDGSNRHDSRFEAIATARARFGYAANNWLFYVTGGGAWSEAQVTRTQLSGTVNAATQFTQERLTNNRFGWAAGGGIEVGLNDHWSMRAEALFLDLGKLTYTFPLAQRKTTATLDMTVARAALNYRFNWGGAPVTARY